MADSNLPLVDLVPLLLIVITVAIAVLAIYKYLKIEKKQSDLVIAIAFLLLTLALITEFFNDMFFDNDLGGLYQYFRILAYLVFLIAIEPIKVIKGK